MTVLLSLILLAGLGSTQDSDNVKNLLQRAESLVRSVKSWRAETVNTSEVLANGLEMHSQVRTKFAVQAPLRMKRENSGDDKTVLVCDGVESFYMGDGHGYYRGSAAINSDCSFPLNSLYQVAANATSLSIIGRDQVLLADGSHACDVVKVEWDGAVRTMCIDPKTGLNLRDVVIINKDGKRLSQTTTFTSYEKDVAFPPDAFKFHPPPGAVESKPPI